MARDKGVNTVTVTSNSLLKQRAGSTNPVASVAISIFGRIFVSVDTMSSMLSAGRLARLCCIADLQTTQAYSSTFFSKQGIEKCKRVTMPAMGFGGVFSPNTYSSKGIGLGRYWFKVLRIYADWVAAQVIGMQPVWDRAFDKFIGKSVCQNVVTDITLETCGERSIALGVRGTFPKPTRYSVPERAIFIHLGPETCNGSQRQGWSLCGAHGGMIPQTG